MVQLRMARRGTNGFWWTYEPLLDHWPTTAELDDWADRYLHGPVEELEVRLVRD